MTLLPQRENQASIIARIAPAISSCLVMVGAAMTALLILRVINAMRTAEAAGIGAVAGGMAEAHLAVVVSLYLAVFVMALGVLVLILRAVMNAATASPSAWFFAILALLSFVPLGMAWEANSLLIQTLRGQGNISLAASTIQTFVTLTVVTAGLVSLVLLAAVIIPLPSFLRAKRNWAPIVMLIVIEVSLIGLAIYFQMHIAWLNAVRLRESF